MISGGKIKDILLKVVKSDPIFGAFPEIKKNKHRPVTKETVKERIVIVLPGGTDNGPLERSYPRICIYIPDVEITDTDKTKYDTPDEGRLTELENHCQSKFSSLIYGEFGDERYFYKLEDIVTEEDSETWSHFLNVRLKFEVVNTKL